VRSYLPFWPSFVPAERHGDLRLRAVAASGTRISFADGTTLLCGTSGLWNANLGYGVPSIAEAIADAARDASYLGAFRVENSYAHTAAEQLISLIDRPEFGRVMFSTAGGAANDLAMKIAKQHFLLAGEQDRRLITGLTNSYHGLTYGSFSITGQPLGQEAYGVDQRHVRHVPPNSTHALEALCQAQGSQIAAVFVEPVLGTGTVVLEPEWLSTLFELRERFGFLIVADEVATGFGRTGPMLATSEWSESPDLIIMSKGMTNGTCAAAAVAISHAVASRSFEAGAGVVHGETQAGTAISCAAITATIDEFSNSDAIANGERVTARLWQRLAELRSELHMPASLRGKGLFITLRLEDEISGEIASENVARLVDAIRAEGAIVYPGLSGIQIVPPLIYTDDEVDELVDAIANGTTEWSKAARRPVSSRS